MKYSIIIILTALFLFGASCNEDPVAADAKQMTLSEIQNVPGFEWYANEKNEYMINQKWLDDIIEEFDPQLHSFLIYAVPSCNCEGKPLLFPPFMKILEEAGITENYFEIYSMNSVDSKHPYSEKVRVNHLPAFYVMKDSVAVYSIIDTLIYQENVEGKNPTLEYLLSVALKK